MYALRRRLSVDRAVWARTLGVLVIVVAWTALPADAGASHRALGPRSQSNIQGTLADVSCVSSHFCMAVGYANGRSLTELWNGSSWVTKSSPVRGSNTFLKAVSCASPKSCVAVGGFSSPAGVSRTLIESWNGRRWSVSTSPSPAGQGSDLLGVSCRSARSCTAVGASGAGALVESLSGSVWSVSSTPYLGPNRSSLIGVDCDSAHGCTAVGVNGNRTLAESWNGTSWSVVSSPTPGNYAVLDSVSCSSPQKCTAVGFESTGTGSGASALPRTLIEQFNGARWSVVPNPSPSVAYLYGVSCASMMSCQAVGTYQGRGTIMFPLVESYVPTVWTIEHPQRSGAGALYGISCSAHNACKAVGTYGPTMSIRLFATWNGRVWS